MKYPEIKVNIPEPCHEDWNQMTPTEKGKFCDVCTKEVIDFSAKSDEEIVKYAVTNKNLCGRFHKTQLDRKLIVDRKKRNHWLSYAASLLFPMALFSQEVKNRTVNIPQTTQTSNNGFKSLNIGSLQKQGKVSTSVQNKKITIKGIVTDEYGFPLPGATILIKGTTTGKTSDFDGNFSIETTVGSTLICSYVGYQEKSYKVENNTSTITFELDETLELLGCVICTFEPETTNPYGYISNYARTSYTKAMTAEQVEERNESTRRYFERQREQWLEKREKRRAKRAERKAARAKRKAAKKDNSQS